MSALLVKKLREMTGAGFLDCKKALEHAKNDLEKAVEWLKEKGAAKAAKKAGAIAADGIVQTISDDKNVVIMELNSQTDFVATNDAFLKLAEKIGKALLKNDFKSIEDAQKIIVEDNKSIFDLTIEATAKIGEKISLRRAKKIAKEGKVIGAYTHVNNRVASIVVAEGGKEPEVRNVAMHVASMNPKFLDEKSVPAEKIKEFEIEIMELPALKDKPDKIKENISKGMLRKKLSELTLLDQEFVMEKMPVSKYLEKNGAKAIAMYRYEVGEGIDKKEENFADEVAAQMKNDK